MINYTYKPIESITYLFEHKDQTELTQDDIYNKVVMVLRNRAAVDANIKSEYEDVYKRTFMNLYILYALNESNPKNRKQKYVYYLKQSDIEEFNIKEKELEDNARYNMDRYNSSRIYNLYDYIAQNTCPVFKFVDQTRDIPISVGYGSSRNAQTFPLFKDSVKDTVLILSNRHEKDGAACILLPEIMDQINEIFGHKNFYILPLSVDKLLIIKEEYIYKLYNKNRKICEEELSDLVIHINEGNDDDDNILSYKYYIYNIDEGVFQALS